ncbi:MAG: hypothetical protein IPO92_15570 [Saprospiraceae bacterium]|nr:hypothetical protein [Saprospiraceae bacterium]
MKYIYLISIIAVLSCSKRTIISCKNDRDVNSLSQKYNGNSQDIKLLKCKSISYNPIEENSNKLASLLICLSDSLGIGNPYYIDRYIDVLNSKIDFVKNWDQTSMILNSKPRGEKVFKALINVANIFECYNDFTLSEDGHSFGRYSIHSFFFKAYTSMIISIDGMSVDRYLEINVPYTPDRRRQEDKDKCQESLYRDYYNAIIKANKEGKIVLKKYGEE